VPPLRASPTGKRFMEIIPGIGDGGCLGRLDLKWPTQPFAPDSTSK
jgi:hypothetical protein